MVSVAQKTKLSRLREQFSRDLARLRLKYGLAEISRKSGIGAANLSSYGSGKKAAGIKVLMQFYKAFAGEIQDPFDDYHPGEAPARESETRETRILYHQDEAGDRNHLVETLKEENSRLLRSLDKLIAANEHLVQSTMMMAETNRKLVEQVIAKSVS